MKISAIRQALHTHQFDAILLTDEKNRRYVTGFHSTAGAVYISQKQAIFFTDFRYIEAARAKITEMDVREIGAGDSYACAINTLIEQDHVQTIALEDDCLTHADYLRWSNNLDAQCTPQNDLIYTLRTVKTPRELEKITQAQRIAELALREVLNEIRVGISEHEIAARLTYLMLHYGAENMSFDPIVVSGPNTSKPHGVPSDRQICTGDFVTMDFGCIYDGYCSDMTRTVAVGSVTEEMQQIYDVVLSAQLAGIQAAKAGVTGKMVDDAARQLITNAGYGDYFGHGFGHGVGLFIHEAPMVSMRNDQPLPSGAVITAEPGIYLPGKFGVRIEDMLFLTENGNENLTLAPKSLIIL